MMKHKHFVAILLSVMMVFTFMPTLAFAQDVETGHPWDDGTVTKKASSCNDYTLTEYKCLGEDVNGDHLDCAASYTSIDWLDHDFGSVEKPNYKNVTADDFLAKAETQLSPEEYTEWYQRIVGDDVCYLLVPACKNCGAYYFGPEGTGTWEYEIIPQFHEAKKGTKPCAELAECKNCGKFFPNPSEEAGNHTWGTPKHEATYCSSVDLTEESDYTEGGYAVYSNKCTVCGKETKERVPNVGTEEAPENIKHDGIGTPLATAPTEAEQKYYVQVDGKWYAPNKTDDLLIERTIKANKNCEMAVEDGAYLECSKCGLVLGTCYSRPGTHEFETKEFAPTCEDKGATLEICKKCGFVKSFVAGADKLGHNYKISVLAEPSCFADGITIAECDRCNGLAVISDWDDDMIEKDAATGKLYFTGFDGELEKTATADTRIEVADYTKKDHDFGKYEDMTEATCENGVLQARKCAVDGNYDVHNTLETGQPLGHKFVEAKQQPTCGAKGFDYTVCSVCGDPGPEYRDTFGEPVVGFGAKCTFDKWVVETKATPFKEGTKKLVCSVCGDDGRYTLSNGVVKETGVTRTTIAKTKIAAPKVKAGKKKATVTVKAVEGAVKYQIKVNGKVKKTVKKAGKVTIKKLAGGKKAKFQIVAFDAEGTKAASKVKSVKIKK